MAPPKSFDHSYPDGPSFACDLTRTSQVWHFIIDREIEAPDRFQVCFVVRYTRCI